ncbi:hypothetical protein FJY93_04280 [Candidatus Kaiserbacteria bacterium]|nr:hypothetical protein [Candidatus Kaiserbacteria bacterium]
MAEKLNDKVSVFPAGAQKAFLEEVEQAFTIDRIAQICDCSTRTIRDWRREKFPMRYLALKRLCAVRKIPIPREVTIRSRYAHVRVAGLLGAQATIQKYGRVPVDEMYRKIRWQEWWDTNGQHKDSPLFRTKQVYFPEHSETFAEFMGIMLGDGGLSERQVFITLHHIDDLQYSLFVRNLMAHLFKVRPRMYHQPRKSVNSVVISRSALVQFLHREGLPVGNKVRQEADVPTWIKKNKKYSLACVRGLVDTDGSIFTHRYTVNGKQYSYTKLGFTSRSAPLRRSVAHILEKLGMSPRISGYDVRLDSIDDLKRYFSIVGSHNPKHLKRYGK